MGHIWLFTKSITRTVCRCSIYSWQCTKLCRASCSWHQVTTSYSFEAIIHIKHCAISKAHESCAFSLYIVLKEYFLDLKEYVYNRLQFMRPCDCRSYNAHLCPYLLQMTSHHQVLSIYCYISHPVFERLETICRIASCLDYFTSILDSSDTLFRLQAE
ncbi:hypothetical protein BS78_09G215500 [Paspalum vaginatum]|nr:hypothetical protein BS78_09G215500 [Paspalum vaginatum]